MSNMNEEAKRIVGAAIQKLYSNNPYERQQAIETINSHEAFFARNMAYSPALQLYEKETDLEVKRGLLRIIATYALGKDQKALDLFVKEIENSDMAIQWAAFDGLKGFKEKSAVALPKLVKMAEAPNTSSWARRQIMGALAAMGKKAEPAISIITKELASPGWLMRRATRNAVKKLGKSGINVVGQLISQLDHGTVNEKIAACTGLGSLESDAKGSVLALTAALKDPNSEVRAKAAWALMKMEKNAAPAEMALKDVLNDESSAASKYALKALDKLKKLTKDQKREIEEIENYYKEIVKVRKKFGIPELKESKEEEEASPTSEAAYKNLFFMSHALPDFSWVQKAISEIESWPGCKCWTCERDIPHGHDWLEEIYDGIETCNWYILFWSADAAVSKWTNEEIKEAKIRNVNKGKPKITIVNLGKEDWPTLLARSQGSMVKTDDDLKKFLVNLKSQVEL